MKTLSLQKSQGTGIDAVLDGCRKLTVEDSFFGEGGFGAVYRCHIVDGQVVAPLVVKIFHPGINYCYATVTRLQEKLKEEHLKLHHTGSSLFEEYPALAGVPLLSFTGTLDGKTVTGSVARDLTADGLEELQSVEEDNAAHRRFQQIPLASKLQMAHQFARALEFLNSVISFLHCDLKPGAFFFSATPPRCVLIDFDGGAVLRDPTDEPSTPGTPEGWVAPEVREQMDSAIPLASVKVSLASERWSAACAIHFLLFGCSHDFFFTELSERSMRAYQQQFSWPAIRAGFPYLKPGFIPYHAAHGKYVQSLPHDLQKYMSFTFTQGYFAPGQRTTCAQWRLALEATQQPAIHAFGADTLLVTNRLPVTLRWLVTGAAKLELRGIANVTGKDSYPVTVTRDTAFELVLTTKKGKSLTKTLQVKVDDRPPLIRSVRIDRSFLSDATPARLTWDIERAARIEIEPGIGDVTGNSFVEVLPRRNTTYRVNAYSGLGAMATATASITVSTEAPIIIAFKATESFIASGLSVELSWDTSGAEYVEISPGIGPVSSKGSRRLPLTESTLFTLTATSYFQAVSKSTVSIHVAKRTALNPNPTKPVPLTAPLSAKTSPSAGINVMGGLGRGRKQEVPPQKRHFRK